MVRKHGRTGLCLWKNVVTAETSKVAESLDEFRGRYAYNLMDDNIRRFSAEVPQIWQWDDHEVMNNWSDSKDISGDPRYVEKNVRVLVTRAARAFLEYAPMRYHGPDDAGRIYRRIAYGPLLDVFMLDERSYRGSNSDNRQRQPGPATAFLGEMQLAWLKQQLSDSKALWKVISSDMPIGLVVTDDPDAERRARFEAVANGDGPVCGREFEYADLCYVDFRRPFSSREYLQHAGSSPRSHGGIAPGRSATSRARPTRSARRSPNTLVLTDSCRLRCPAIQ
jgi:alkaline phosphatase D